MINPVQCTCQQIQDFLLGIAIGDAFGAGVEFQDRAWIRANVDFSILVNARASIVVPPTQLQDFVQDYHPWTYTDDTEMTIGVCHALMAADPFSEELLVQHWEAEYQQGVQNKGYGRNGHGSMRWYYQGDKTIKKIRDFQRHRHNPGNAPAMRAAPIGLLPSHLINEYARINATATHPNPAAILASQCIARATEWLLVLKGDPKALISYCCRSISLNAEYQQYLEAVADLPPYEGLEPSHFECLCGPQPIQAPYFLPGIHGLPSDAKYTTGAVLYLLTQSLNPFDGLRKAIYLGGDVDSVAALVTGILAGRMGLDTLPDFMRASVEGKDYLKGIGKTLHQTLIQQYGLG